MKHDLIKTGDSDSFRQIEDRNGEVVLGYCRVCKKGEGELEKECNPVDISEELAERWIEHMRRRA